MYSKSSLKTLLVLTVLAMVFSLTAHAQVTAEMTASKIVAQGDKETRDAADKAKPGDVIEYRVVYKNAGKSPVKNVQGSLPVPIGMELLPQSPQPADVTATVEGTTYAKLPLKRIIVAADGKQKEVEIPIAEVRGIRWNLGQLQAGESREVVARMRLQSVVVAEPAKSASK